MTDTAALRAQYGEWAQTRLDEACYRNELARRLVNALPAVLTELEQAREYLADEDNWHNAYDRLTALMRQRFPPRSDGSLPDWRVEDICAELQQARADVAKLREALQALINASHSAGYDNVLDRAKTTLVEVA